MSNYYTLKNSPLFKPPEGIDLGDQINNFDEIYLTGNVYVDGNIVIDSLSAAPKILSLEYVGDNLAAATTGSEWLIIRGTGFKTGVTVKVDNVTIASNRVTLIDSSTITFRTSAKATGYYHLSVTNTDSGTASYIPGIFFSPNPTWAIGDIITYYSGQTVNFPLSLNNPNIPIRYTKISGTLPSGVSLSSAGKLSGNLTNVASYTTYSFTVEAIDYQNQTSTIDIVFEVLPDSLTWSLPVSQTDPIPLIDVNDFTTQTLTLRASFTSGSEVTFIVATNGGLPDYTIEKSEVYGDEAVYTVNINESLNSQATRRVRFRAQDLDRGLYEDILVDFRIAPALGYYNIEAGLIQYNRTVYGSIRVPGNCRPIGYSSGADSGKCVHLVVADVLYDNKDADPVYSSTPNGYSTLYQGYVTTPYVLPKWPDQTPYAWDNGCHHSTSVYAKIITDENRSEFDGYIYPDGWPDLLYKIWNPEDFGPCPYRTLMFWHYAFYFTKPVNGWTVHNLQDYKAFINNYTDVTGRINMSLDGGLASSINSGLVLNLERLGYYSEPTYWYNTNSGKGRSPNVSGQYTPWDVSVDRGLGYKGGTRWSMSIDFLHKRNSIGYSYEPNEEGTWTWSSSDLNNSNIYFGSRDSEYASSRTYGAEIAMTSLVIEFTE